MTQPQLIKTHTDEYEILEAQGQGGFGLTYRAKRKSNDQLVIVKTLRTERLKEWKSLELFEREVKILRGLSHPNIPAYIDSFREGDPEAPSALGLIQEFIPGKDLAHRMRHGPPLTEEEMLSWFSQILGVLSYLHSLSPPVIHRDITPKNILVRPDGRAFLLDFGAVQAAVLSASTLASTAAGTFGYAPMEQFMGRAFPESDLYGLAMTYLAVSTGKEPEMMEIEGVRLNVRKTIRANARITLLLHDMTEPDPSRRLSKAQDALERLQPLLMQAPPKEEPSERPKEVSSPRPAPATPTVASLPPASTQQLPRAPEKPREEEGWPGLDAAWLQKQKERVERLGGQALLSPPAHHFREPENFVLSADGSALFLKLYETSWVVDLEELTASPGDLDEAAFNDELSCISPDLRLRATRKGDNSVRLNERKSGKKLQTLSADVSRGLAFSPDAHFLVCIGAEALTLFGQAGEQIKIPGRAIAFGADGHRILVANELTLRWGELVAGQREPNWKGEVFGTGVGVIQQIALRSDDQVLLVVGNNGASLLSPETGELFQKLDTQPWGQTPITNVGFTSDGLRVVICAEQSAVRSSSKRAKAAFVWSLEGRYLGAIGLVNEKPLAQLESGLFCWLEANAKAGGGWNRPELVRAVLGDAKTLEGLLSEEEKDLLEDYQARVRFWGELREAFSRKVNLPMLVDACRGITHLMPLIIQSALRKVERGPVFGQAASAEVEIGGQELIEAAKEMESRPKEEREVLFEDFLRKTRQEEEETQREQEEEQEQRRKARQEALEEERRRSVAQRLIDEALEESEAKRKANQEAQRRRQEEEEERNQRKRAQAYYEQGLALEKKEDGKWFRKKDYQESIAALQKAHSLGHEEALSAIMRIKEKA